METIRESATSAAAPAVSAGSVPLLERAAEGVYPTLWQRKVVWAALSALAVAAIGALAVGVIWLLFRVLAFLQPLLTPFAVAGVLAYLLEPVVARLVRLGTSRKRAVLLVFAAFSAAALAILVGIVPAISEQSANMAKRVPAYIEQARATANRIFDDLRTNHASKLALLFPDIAERLAARPKPPAPAAPIPEGPPADASADPEDAAPAAAPAPVTLEELLSGAWIRDTIPGIARGTWNFVVRSVGGFLGVFGFLLSFVIVPLYLYYFLADADQITRTWSDYLPLRDSAFKDEVVASLNEINSYLIAFFRGQLVVSLINGTATGLGLVLVGLDFGLLIGLALCFLGLIPYLGIILCWIPSVIIASLQGGSWMVPAEPVWLFPLVVTLIFVVWQQVDGWIITPRVVGDSVGLHPMTVIIAVFAWSLFIGGLLGAILAVPLTATLKVLLRRYVWRRRIGAAAAPAPAAEGALA